MIREATEKDRQTINTVATHPLQSWEWGEFRMSTGVEVTRLVETKDKRIVNIFQITWHKLPGLKKYIGYCPKSVVPSQEVVDFVLSMAKTKRAILVKFEPNEVNKELGKGLLGNQFRVGRSLFTKFTFVLDIKEKEEEILAKMHQKTRYNIRLAEKKGVVIREDNSQEAFEKYWQIMEETTKRQGFYAHTKQYHQKMLNQMTKSGMGHLFTASYQGEVITTWIVFVLNKVVYYPYGASSNKYREVMANNLMMWEVIKFGKKNGCQSFDMWGSLGPNPKTTDPWFGFHKFKQGYGGVLTEFLGTYDLVVDKRWYIGYTVAEKLRWLWLRMVKKSFS